MVKGLQQKLANENPQRAADAEKIHSLISKTIQHAHDLALDLASDYDGENLARALEQLAQRVKNVFSIECTFEKEADLSLVPPGVAAHLYKIAQEALTNGIKHGKGRRLAVRLAREQQTLLLSIWNDGLPFPAEISQKSRMGLRIMNYRAHVIGGSLDVQSDEKSGTTVLCTLPLRALESVEPSQRLMAVAE
jgi:two-component system CheB/CheR fusion protein